jgi:transposase
LQLAWRSELGRKLDHKTLEEIRRMAVERVWNGEKPSIVIASYGFSRQIIYKWLREARGKGRGLRALVSRGGTGAPRTLTPKQQQQLFRWINGKDPRQHGFDFGMWTRLIVRKLIADKFEANLHHPDSRQHRRAAFRRDQDQRFHRGLPFRSFGQLRDVVTGVLKRDQLASGIGSSKARFQPRSANAAPDAFIR